MTGDFSRELGTLAGARATARVGRSTAAATIQAGNDAEETVEAVIRALDLDFTPDLAIVFIDSRFADAYGDILARLRRATGTRRLVGCSGQATIGPGLEIEGRAAISVLALASPSLDATPFVIPGSRIPSELAGRLDAGTANAWLLFSDPLSSDPAAVIEQMEGHQSRAPIAGGLVSSHRPPLGLALFLDEEIYRAGSLAVGLSGSVRVRGVVAQGAEPLGEPWNITDCDRGLIRAIGSRPTVDILLATLQSLDRTSRASTLRNLLVGLAIDEYRDDFGRGDFLIRTIQGIDRSSGAVAINDQPRVGQTLQFQYRDADAADADLALQLTRLRRTLRPDEVVLGALLFACASRGRGLFATPNHDAQALVDHFGAVPSAGLFCGGEIGPVGDRSLVHSLSASVALLTLGGDATGS